MKWDKNSFWKYAKKIIKCSRKIFDYFGKIFWDKTCSFYKRTDFTCACAQKRTLLAPHIFRCDWTLNLADFFLLAPPPCFFVFCFMPGTTSYDPASRPASHDSSYRPLFSWRIFFETLSQALVEFAENDVAVSLMIDFNGTTLMAQRTEILAVSQISISSDIPDFSPPTCQRKRWSIIDSAKIPPRGWLHFSYFSLIISYVNLKS